MSRGKELRIVPRDMSWLSVICVFLEEFSNTFLNVQWKIQGPEWITWQKIAYLVSGSFRF